MHGQPDGSTLLSGVTSRPRAMGLILALGLLLFLLPSVMSRYTPHTWLVGDGGFYLNMQKSLTRWGTLDQSRLHPHSWYSGKKDIDDGFSNIALGSDGEWWPKHSYVMPVVALPFYWLFGVDGTLIFNVSMIIAMLVIAYLLARRFVPPGIAATAAFVIGVGGPYQEYAYNYSNDGFYTVLILGGLLATLHRRLGIGGILYGLACWTKITSALVAPLFLVALLFRADLLGSEATDDERSWKGRFRDVLTFAAWGMIPLGGFALANWYMFGKPWVTSYQRVLVVVGGKLTTASHTNLFTTPLKEGLEQMFIRERTGLLTGYPASVLAWLGFGPLLLHKRSRWLALGIIGVAVTLLVFFARFKYYHERFLFPYFGLMVIPAAVVFDRVAIAGRQLAANPRRLTTMLTLVLAAAIGVRISSHLRETRQYRLSHHIESARVLLGDEHCDYFNNMRWSWECSRNRGDVEFVGVNAGQEHTFDGQKVDGMIHAAGHHSRKPRRLIFPQVPLGDALVLRYGLDDRSRAPCDTEFIVTVGDREVHRIMLRKPGELHETRIDTQNRAGETADVIVDVKSRARDRSRFVFDAWVE